MEIQNTTFLDSLADRKEAESTRSGATRARVLFANGLYRQLAQFCATGEAYWQLTDATKAREYVVNPTVAKAVPA